MITCQMSELSRDFRQVKYVSHITAHCGDRVGVRVRRARTLKTARAKCVIKQRAFYCVCCACANTAPLSRRRRALSPHAIACNCVCGRASSSPPSTSFDVLRTSRARSRMCACSAFLVCADIQRAVCCWLRQRGCNTKCAAHVGGDMLADLTRSECACRTCRVDESARRPRPFTCWPAALASCSDVAAAERVVRTAALRCATRPNHNERTAAAAARFMRGCRDVDVGDAILNAI